MAEVEVHEPQVNLDESLIKTRDIVSAIQELHHLQEDAETRAEREAAMHQKTREQVMAVEGEHAKVRDAHDREVKGHWGTKEKLEKEERSNVKTRDALQASKDDMASMRLQMEALKVGLEAQRKAFVVNVNWAVRCTELKAKCDKAREDHDKLLEQHKQASADWEAKQEELLAKKAELTGDIKAKLDRLEAYKAKDMQNMVAKKAGRQKTLSVLQRSLAQEEQGLLRASYSGWASLTKGEKQNRLAKEKAMASAARTIANEGPALLAQVLVAWVKTFQQGKRAQILAANKRLEESQASAGEGAMRSRRRVLKELEKQYAGQDISLLKETLTGWMCWRSVRKKKDQGSQKALRTMANSSRAVTADVFQIWNMCADSLRKKKQAKAASAQKATRLIANSDVAVKAEIILIWTGIVTKCREARKAKTAGMEKAMRLMANSDISLLNLCYDSWARIRCDHKKKAKASQRALRLISNSQEAVKVSCFQGWVQEYSRTRSKKKSNAKAARLIANSDECVQATVLRTWNEFMKKKKDTEKKLRAVQKTIGGSEKGLKMLVTTAWHTWAQKEARGKKAKRRSMKTAIKSITGMQEILLMQVFLSIARVCRGHKMRSENNNKIHELVAELDDSRRKAKVIGDELDKVGMFLNTHTPRRATPTPIKLTPRPPDGVLPRIDGGTRPRSGGVRSTGSAKAAFSEDRQQ